MKIRTLATAAIVITLAAQTGCSSPSADGERWESPSKGGTAWGSQAPRVNHYTTQICVEVRGCIACVYAHVDSDYADSKRPDGALALAELARQVTHDIDRKEPDACSRFLKAVERKAAHDTNFQLNCSYMKDDLTWESHCERKADKGKQAAPASRGASPGKP